MKKSKYEGLKEGDVRFTSICNEITLTSFKNLCQENSIEIKKMMELAMKAVLQNPMHFIKEINRNEHYETIQDYAKYTNLTPKTIRKYCKEGNKWRIENVRRRQM